MSSIGAAKMKNKATNITHSSEIMKAFGILSEKEGNRLLRTVKKLRELDLKLEKEKRYS